MSAALGHAVTVSVDNSGDPGWVLIWAAAILAVLTLALAAVVAMVVLDWWRDRG